MLGVPACECATLTTREGWEWRPRGERSKLTSLQSLSALLAQATGSGGGALMWLPLVLIFVIFYFLLIMPQQRKQKKWQAMLSELKTGDKVVTSGGIRGTIIALRDDSLHLRVPPDNLRIEVTRASVVTVSTGDEAVTK